MWSIPPIIGQKVMLDPSYVHYKDFNRAQAKGNDGYILAVTGMNLVKWLINASEPAITVMWENGHENSYELKALLPIDSFKTIERVEFKGGSFLNVVSEKSRDYIAERVILKNDDVKHYNFFDKEKRLEILRKAEDVYGTLNEEVRHKESVQMKYMSILEEIERTKRAEEVALFLEGESVTTPKKHQEVNHPQPQDTSELSDIERTLRDWEAMSPIADANFINPCRELPLNNCREIELPLGTQTLRGYAPGEIVTLPSRSAQGRSIYDISVEEFRANISPYMEEMERLGRLRREEQELQRQLDENEDI